jgi:uncharacterized membrane protein YqhA
MKHIFRFIISLPILFTLLLGVIFIMLGIYDIYKGAVGMLQGYLETDQAPGLRLMEALDMFLISFLFFIFSMGFAQLFMPDSRIGRSLDEITPTWLVVKNFTQLKLILWETVLTTLVVLFLSIVFKSHGEYKWEYLLIPIAIFLISLSTFLIRKSERDLEGA